MRANVFDFSQLTSLSKESYYEFVRTSSLSLGIYVLDPGAQDLQKPHTEDEVYYVASGHATMLIESEEMPHSFAVSPGAIIFVPAHVRHYFYDITERLALLVFFARSPQEVTHLANLR